MRFSVISSGSKANSTYIDCGKVKLLIDCGLSAKQLEIRIRELGEDPSKISAILVTHEHHDHIHGVGTLSRRFKIPVLATRATAESIERPFGIDYCESGQEFELSGVKIEPFSVVHDAVDPVAFRIRAAGFTLVQLTDLGRVTTLVQEKVLGANALVLESNHDQELLQSCDYSWSLKQRISSTHGHLCNDAASQLLADTIHPELWHVVLGHLSENSNRPDLALSTAHRYLAESPSELNGLQTLLCGSVYKATPMIELEPIHGGALQRSIAC